MMNMANKIMNVYDADVIDIPATIEELEWAVDAKDNDKVAEIVADMKFTMRHVIAFCQLLKADAPEPYLVQDAYDDEVLKLPATMEGLSWALYRQDNEKAAQIVADIKQTMTHTMALCDILKNT